MIFTALRRPDIGSLEFAEFDVLWGPIFTLVSADVVWHGLGIGDIMEFHLPSFGSAYFMHVPLLE